MSGHWLSRMRKWAKKYSVFFRGDFRAYSAHVPQEVSVTIVWKATHELIEFSGYDVKRIIRVMKTENNSFWTIDDWDKRKVMFDSSYYYDDVLAIRDSRGAVCNFAVRKI